MIWTAFIVAFFTAFWAPKAFALTASEITKDLTCTCGCNMVVSACEGSMECSPAKQITDQVAQMVNEGQSKEEIIQYFVKTKGERILAAPTKKGFNLTAWILPFFAIVLGAIGLYTFLNRCLSSRKNIESELKVSEKVSISEKKYFDQFEKELKSFDS
jgi:cytochrome c-type biogenesis protein CcmH